MSRADRAEAATDLLRLGFFDALPAGEREAAAREVAEFGYPFYHDDLDRLFMADTEDLAEGGVGNFLEELTPRLGRAGINLGPVEQSYSEHGYQIEAIGRRFDIWTAEEGAASERGELNLWCLTANRVQLIINDLLELAGSTERLYWIGGGEDGFVCFLTPEMQRVIEFSQLLTGDDLPRIITCD